MKSYYEILGITNKSNQDDIKKAYRKLAKKLHPDLNPNNEHAAKQFAEVQTAYETLGDESKRKEYDNKSGDFNKYEKSNSNTRNSTSYKSKDASSTIDFGAMHNSFESFFGFDPKTGNISNEEKMNLGNNSKKNPLDTSDMFDKFMGFKK